MTKQDILNRLKEGNKRFITDKPEGKSAVLLIKGTCQLFLPIIILIQGKLIFYNHPLSHLPALYLIN